MAATTTIAAPTNRAAMEALGLHTLRGQTVTVTGHLLPGHVEVPAFTAEVVATNFSFDRIVFVEVIHPKHGRETVAIERARLHV